MRRFSSARCLYKNPYFYYDLGKLQPKPDYTERGVSGNYVFDPLASRSKESMRERVSKVFGQLGDRSQSRKSAELLAITVAGVKVPARPEEPTNCCMSGCVNCVWELYKDEITEWKDQVKKAKTALLEPKNISLLWPVQLGPEPESRIRERGAVPSESSVKEAIDEDDDDGLSVGIRHFIETEKRIRARREAQQRHASP